MLQEVSRGEVERIVTAAFTNMIRTLRRYIFTPEFWILVCSLVFLRMLYGLISRSLRSDVSIGPVLPPGAGLGRVPVRPGSLNTVSPNEARAVWSKNYKEASVYAVQGARAYMEDRYSVVERFNDTDISIYAIYDGHGGEFCSEYAEHAVTRGVMEQIINAQQANSLSSLKIGNILRQVILEVDKKVTDIIRDAMDISGSTALVAVTRGSEVVVANVGDSRGVLCDMNIKPVSLSFDHKPAEFSERQRIEKAGGFIAYNGVWRVAGILATSRALGDFPLKDKNYVIAEPDVRTFALSKSKFFVLASDGLWDVMSNEEVCDFIEERLTTRDRGAKELVQRAVRLGSLDNISAIVVQRN